MPKPRNIHNLAIERAVEMGKFFFQQQAVSQTEALGEPPAPERKGRIGVMPADTIIDEIVQMIPESGGTA